MEDYKTPLQTEYYSKLNGAITYGGNSVGVYDVVPEDVRYPYIQIGETTDNDWSTKSSFGTDNTLLLSIVDRFESGHQGTRKAINSVANDIFGIIRVRPVTLAPTGFKVLTVTVEADNDRQELSATHLYKIREIRLSHLIQET